MEVFLDSFECPKDYVYFQADEQLMEGIKNNDDYLILQKTNHPKFTLNEGDTILYSNGNDVVFCNKIYSISCIGTFKKYHVANMGEYQTNYPVYECQIIGKVVSIVDNNLWNVLSIKLWDISIHNLNAHALFINK